MNRDIKYKLTIGILFSVIIVQMGFILSFYLKKIRPLRGISGRIAIVLDDWGYNLNNLEILKDIEYPITLAILPHLEYSEKIANFAKVIGKEIILHLPLEPKTKKDYIGWERFTITTDMPEKKIKEILSEAIDSLFGIKGVSNHMGSRATEDERTMTIIFKELKKRKLYFLDNLTSPNSVSRRIAERLSLKFIRRDIFLDNLRHLSYIKNQFKKLKIRALKKSWAVGIGHCDRITLEVLKEQMPMAEKEGFRFVFLSELIK
ncbi:MAG: divergent polysaccharide deacetylase family protein [Candidatus Omnitrophica bacterium]|nr:divergent polysaccharide deacetylase family protein [Candidatus Omnitrophota bacterium]